MGELHFADYTATIRWNETGEGQPVVVLPGLSMPIGNSFDVLKHDPRLAGRRFVMIDFLGSGISDHPSNFDYALSSHARTIAHVMDHLGLNGVDVLGHSMGGTVGIRLALDHPERVARLLVAESNLAPGGGVATRRVVREDPDDFREHGFSTLIDEMREKGIKRLAEGWAQADPFGMWKNAEALVNLDPDFLDAFLSLSIPRTFVIGERNLAHIPAPDLPDPALLEAAGIRVKIVADAGHPMMVDNPDGFAEAVLAAFPLGA